MPKLKNIGSTSANNSSFNGVGASTTIKVPYALSHSNNGVEEGDLTSARNLGATIEFLAEEEIIVIDSEVPALDIDWSLPSKHRIKTLQAGDALTFSNLIKYKLLTLELTGGTLTLPASIPVEAYQNYDPAEINLIHIYPVSTVSGSEKFDVTHVVL